ncbi:hypothetical protein CK203_117569 [Vitis vinifera]|uniref:Integrase catalytic domain-containing protein n=1 Tax=Vitis vinifera TaxID=29760 RepID=A0A438CTI4_VITVI|nr:hypothetical protein CK203_117569 [Vitis vinifera]
MMDLDMALREDEPPKPTNESTEAMRAHYAKWERSNIPTSDNAEAGYFMDELMNMRYNDMKGVGIRNLRKPSEKESKLKVGSDIGIDVEHIGIVFRIRFCLRTEVEKQLGKVKIVRSDRGGEYYGKHGDAGQQNGLFARYLQDNGIVAQYTMPGSPEQNDVAERVVESQVAKFLELDVADSIPSQSNERLEPMDVISLPLPVSDVNLDVELLIMGFSKELLLSISPLSK